MSLQLSSLAAGRAAIGVILQQGRVFEAKVLAALGRQVTLELAGQRVQAWSTLPLQPGELLRLAVREIGPGRVVLSVLPTPPAAAGAGTEPTPIWVRLSAAGLPEPVRTQLSLGQPVAARGVSATPGETILEAAGQRIAVGQALPFPPSMVLTMSRAGGGGGRVWEVAIESAAQPAAAAAVVRQAGLTPEPALQDLAVRLRAAGLNLTPAAMRSVADALPPGAPVSARAAAVLLLSQGLPATRGGVAVLAGVLEAPQPVPALQAALARAFPELPAATYAFHPGQPPPAAVAQLRSVMDQLYGPVASTSHAGGPAAAAAGVIPAFTALAASRLLAQGQVLAWVLPVWWGSGPGNVEITIRRRGRRRALDLREVSIAFVLETKHLGLLAIHLAISRGAVSCTVRAADERVRDFLAQRGEALRQNLQAVSLQVRELRFAAGRVEPETFRVPAPPRPLDLEV